MQKLSTSMLRQIVKLKNQKNRTKNKLFLVEGKKIVLELEQKNLVTFIVISKTIFENEEFMHLLVSKFGKNKIFIVDDFQRVSTVKNGEGVLGVVNFPINYLSQEFNDIKKMDKILAVFKPSDPGNLGTLIRTAVWFDYKAVILIGDTVDPFSPKVVRASMGGVLRITILRCKTLDSILKHLVSHEKIGTFLNYKSNYCRQNNQKKKVLFLGSEAHGLPISLEKYMDSNLLIKKFGNMESLNLAVAAGLLMERLV